MVETCKNGNNGIVCRRRNINYLLTCDICSAKAKSKSESAAKKDDGTEDDNDEDNDTPEMDSMPPFSYVGEAIRSSAERCKNHYDGLINGEDEAPMYKHQILHHSEEEKVTFTLKVLKKFQSSFARQCAEAVAIEMREVGPGGGPGLLNSKNSFNRSSVPRLCLVVGDKLQQVPEESVPEIDEEEIFRTNARRRRKNPRGRDDQVQGPVEVGGTNIPLPPPKRRRPDPKNTSDTNRVDPEASERVVISVQSVTRSDHEQIQQKQFNSIPSHFPIFNHKFKANARPEQTGTRAKVRRKKTVNPPKFNYKTIVDHFNPKSNSPFPTEHQDSGQPDQGES